MALLADNFLRPEGKLDSSWLEDMSLTLDSLITQAETLTDNERAQESWVYAQVYRRIADSIMYQPSTVQSDDVKEVRSLGQIRYWSRLADQYQRDFQSLIGQGASGDTQVIPVW